VVADHDDHRREASSDPAEVGRFREPGHLDNPVRQNLWRAGHAHPGVLVILTLAGLLVVDQADLSGELSRLVRYSLVAGPILMPVGFFVSIASPRAQNPNRLIRLHRSAACRSASAR
jgi:hypothetical protein